MRPIALELKGFTSFRDEQRIDFEDLDLFAISGPTGSGKSSILDAITYALFGWVERVGNQVGQLLSQGQSRMAVTFEFGIGEERYRVTRSTPAKGVTKILLERWVSDGWVQAGEGADRVREATAIIRDAIGLDYVAFTRSVLLPQGQFAEFLVGEAKDRRKILTELLGLELFERLAKRAGELKREAQVVAESDTRVLEAEYAGATEAALEAARQAVTETEAREDSLAVAEGSADALATRWAAVEHQIRELRSCAKDALAAALAARDAADKMEGFVRLLAGTEVEAERASKAAAAARKAEGKAKAAHGAAVTDRGTATVLAGLRARAEGLGTARDALREAEAELLDARKALPVSEGALEEASRRREQADSAVQMARQILEEAKETLEDARHADLVATVRASLQVGEDCPVCGAKLESLPKGKRAPSIGKATAARDTAKARADAATKVLDRAIREVDEAALEVRSADRDVKKAEAGVSKRQKEVDAIEAALVEAFGGRLLPSDPVRVLDERLETLDRLRSAVDEASEAVREAERVAAEAKAAHADVLAGVGETRARLEGVSVSGLLERASEAAGGELTLPHVPATSRKHDPTSVAATAAGTADALEELAVGLEELAGRRSVGEGALLDEAREALGDLVGDARSLAELSSSIGEARRQAIAGATAARRDVEELERKLLNAETLRQKIAAQRERAERFGALALELRADRIIAFLQMEALQLLAAAGSERLAMLSSERYRLEYVDDEFFVVDTWNGEERRSVRTLSGGETFLASLALALALSEQVRALAVTEKARLDSLFLDEGFGTLDPDTLEVVVEAIEQLGGDGRMVGVITHVRELAVRLPARIEVERSPRGSRLEVVR